MNIWHAVPKDRITSEKFTVCIEISKGMKNKYELDKETGALKLDRILFTSTHYPHNYGFIPRTYADDNDPLDVLVICPESILPLTLVDCYPIGVLKMLDQGFSDEKIIAVACNDPFYGKFKEISELPAHISDEIIHFFEVYKTLEYKTTTVSCISGSKEAKEIIAKAIESYEKNIYPHLKRKY